MCKKIVSIIMVIVCLISLSACDCIHSWSNATCTEPQICKTCGETKGEALGHNWIEDSVSGSQGCTRCGALRTLSPIDNEGFEETEMFKSMVAYLQQQLAVYKPEFEYKNNTSLLYIYMTAPEGSAEALIDGSQETLDAWNGMVENMKSFTEYVTTRFSEEGYFIGCALLMRSDANAENALLTMVNGEVLYNIADEAK